MQHCAGDDGHPPPKLSELEQLCHDLNPPEFGEGRPYRPQPAKAEGSPAIGQTSWYFGQSPWSALQTLRSGSFVAERDLPAFRELIQRWRHPNGLVWAMAIANYGRAGAWTESLGVNAPLQEMMLQSWDGALRIFPAWPGTVDARFENFRAEGAFLVSASWSQGQVQSLEILSERGARCQLYSPWPGGPGGSRRCRPECEMHDRSIWSHRPSRPRQEQIPIAPSGTVRMRPSIQRVCLDDTGRSSRCHVSRFTPPPFLIVPPLPQCNDRPRKLCG